LEAEQPNRSTNRSPAALSRPPERLEIEQHQCFSVEASQRGPAFSW